MDIPYYMCDGFAKRRFKQVDNGNYEWYRWAGNALVGIDFATSTWTPGPQSWLVHGPGGVLGTFKSGSPNLDYAYLFKDRLGSVRYTFNDDQDMTGWYTYTPYGEPGVWANWGPNPRFGFTGHQRDDESGMYYAPYRYYIPGSGTWMSRDPIGLAGGWNTYGYVGGNPVNFVDPDGRLCLISCILIAGGIALATAIFGALIVDTVAVADDDLADVLDQIDSSNSNDRTGRSNPGRMNEHKPRGVDHVDHPHNDNVGGKDHIHLDDGTAFNWDGTISHESKGIPSTSNKIREWVEKHGWTCPPKN